MPATSNILVITGDIVSSTALDADRLEACFDALRLGADRLASWIKAPVPLTRHRGDGWQIALPAASMAPLRAALTMRAALRQTDKAAQSRMALALGPGEIPEHGDLNHASGGAFVASGRALDQLTGSATIADARGGPQGAAAALADHISSGWSMAQARSMLPMLAPDRPTQDQVAQDLGITRQAVRQSLIAAGFPALSLALDMLESP
ncbi:MarR family transcriptional regulator [Pseudooceanicola sp. MF1-13]|uniref:MarR family transcriptional regulator n=1 Tax=Pseudooceanicola sp. MF1-13 TaxID=3379095 RepID=UPI003891FEE4